MPRLPPAFAPALAAGAVAVRSAGAEATVAAPAGHERARSPRRQLERQLDDSRGRDAIGDVRTAPGSASRRSSASAIGPSRGEAAKEPILPTSRSASSSAAPGAAGALRRRPRSMAVRLALPIQPRDRLLPDVAALRVGHRPLVKPGLLRHRRLVDLDAEARATVLDPHGLGDGLVDRHGAGGEQRVASARPSARSRRAGRGRPRCGSRAPPRRPRSSRGSSCSASRARRATSSSARGPISDSSPRWSVRLCSCAA